MIRTILTVAALVGLAVPASACMNDVESSQHEREFRSDYGEPTYTPPIPPAPSLPMATWLNPALFGGGAALLTGAGFLMVTRRTRA